MEFKRWRNLSEILPQDVEEFCNSFNSEEPILRELRELATREKVPILLPSAAQLLRLIVKLRKPRKVLEVGTGIGYSTLTIHFASPESSITTVDSNPKRLKTAESFFQRANAPVETVLADGLEFMREALSAGEEYDLIFIDSTKGEYPFYIYKVEALLSDRGIAIFDNVLFRGLVAKDEKEIPDKYKRSTNLLKLFLNQLVKFPNYSTIILPIGDGFAIHQPLR
ncbi:O-methyltransferase [Thermovibrio ammonificans]|jgi:predicted O-methyltransferase YrrM